MPLSNNKTIMMRIIGIIIRPVMRIRIMTYINIIYFLKSYI